MNTIKNLLLLVFNILTIPAIILTWVLYMYIWLSSSIFHMFFTNIFQTDEVYMWKINQKLDDFFMKVVNGFNS